MIYKATIDRSTPFMPLCYLQDCAEVINAKASGESCFALEDELAKWPREIREALVICGENR